MANATDPRISTASGRPPEVDRGPTPTEETRPDGQKADHWVLSDEERSKGYVRPVRLSYRHVGLPVPPLERLRNLTPEEEERFGGNGYVKFEPYGENRAPVTGRFWTLEQLKRGNVCGAVTAMPVKCAETWAVDIHFYGQTFCCSCGGYFSVEEFVWLDGERLGT